jgi:hypothetical protein
MKLNPRQITQSVGTGRSLAGRDGVSAGPPSRPRVAVTPQLSHQLQGGFSPGALLRTKLAGIPMPPGNAPGTFNSTEDETKAYGFYASLPQPECGGWRAPDR